MAIPWQTASAGGLHEVRGLCILNHRWADRASSALAGSRSRGGAPDQRPQPKLDMQNRLVPKRCITHFISLHFIIMRHCLVGLVVKAFISRVADPKFDSRLHCADFSRPSHTSHFKIGTPVATLQASGATGKHRDWLAWCQYTVTG